MFRKCFSLMLVLVFCSTTCGVAARAKGKATGKWPEVEKIRQKVLKRGAGLKARARVKLTDGTKLRGYVSETAPDDFTLVRTDEQTGAAVKINYRDVAEFKAEGKGMSTTSKVLIGAGVGVAAGVVIIALSFRNFRLNLR